MIQSTANEFCKGAHIYCRISCGDKDNITNELSLDAQEHNCKNYCNILGIPILSVTKEIASARYLSRQEQLHELAKIIKPREGIFVSDPSRFSRDLKNGMIFAEELMQKNCCIHMVAPNYCFNSIESLHPQMDQLLFASEMESNNISNRVKTSINYRRAMGHVIGNPQFGYCCKKNAKGIRKEYKNDHEQQIIKIICGLYQNSTKINKIADILNQYGYKYRNKPWTSLRVRYVIKISKQKNSIKIYNTRSSGRGSLAQSVTQSAN